MLDREELRADGDMAPLKMWADRARHDPAYRAARQEHAWLLRAEGEKYREIGRRLGVCESQARRMVKGFGRRISRASQDLRTAIASLRARQARDMVARWNSGGSPDDDARPWGWREMAARHTVAWFPHADNPILDCVGREFAQFGWSDAVRRGISDSEWLWRRSRFMAGFR